MCRIWNVEGESAEIPLSSNGVSVKWHRQLPNTILIGETNGKVGLYNHAKSTWEASVYHCGLLRSVSWNPLNVNIIGAAIDQKWMIWDLGKHPAKIPQHSAVAHAEGVSDFQFNNSNMFATCTNVPGLPNASKLVKIFPNAYTKVLNAHLGSKELLVGRKGQSDFHDLGQRQLTGISRQPASYLLISDINDFQQ
jgi:hypothetical protein